MEVIKIKNDDGAEKTNRLLIGILGVALTIGLLLGGFVFLRDTDWPQAIVTIIAIVWGIGSVALLYFTLNSLVEGLPDVWMRRLQPWVFVGPALLILGWYLAVPTVRTFLVSLGNPQGDGLEGFGNYAEVFTNRTMQEAIRNNITWMIFGTTLTVGFGLLIAILADRSRFENIAKSLIFMPMAISMVGAGVIWKFVYDLNPNIGMLNAIAGNSGAEPQGWLTLLQPQNNYFLIIVMVWLQTGYAMVLLSAAIKGVPDELLEAARVDGANEIQIFTRIIIPNIAGTLLTVITTVVIFTLKIFDVVMVMTGGQYGTEVIGVRFYREMFTSGNQGYAAAIAVILLLAVVPVMIYNLRQFSKREAF